MAVSRKRGRPPKDPKMSREDRAAQAKREFEQAKPAFLLASHYIDDPEFERAEDIGLKIYDYWRKRGHKIEVRYIPVEGSDGIERFDIRTNLLNARPRPDL